MRIGLLSDLHFEFQRDKGKSFVASCDPRGLDLLVLAGDITKMSVGFDRALGFFRKRYDCPIVYVHGNHDFYGSDRETVVRATKHAVAQNQGVHWLDCDILEVCGRRILGAPLWYAKRRPPAGSVSSPEEWAEGFMRYYHPEAKRIVMERWPDFDCIDNLSSWVYDEHARSVNFFLDNLREGDIAVSHMLPSRVSSPQRFENALSQCFFLTDMTPIIEERKAALWLHGHTHDSVDTLVGATRIVCNPYGYIPRHLNPGFIENLIIEVPPLTIPDVPTRVSA